MDFVNLQQVITKKLSAALQGRETLHRLASAEQLAPVAGLTQHELLVLGALAGSVGTPDGKISVFTVQRDSEQAGLTKLGFALGLRRLQSKSLVEATNDEDYNGNVYDALRLTVQGWDWIEENESKFVTNRNDHSGGITNDDIPF